ncbi:uncharacterized protein LOC135473879 [Liolophura sinensis]|uniref:uncharacterized protein LOC135473879 n=1 Tax=Liolophura sinensis TaxID=3198878 RepID=UPI0031588CB8
MLASVYIYRPKLYTIRPEGPTKNLVPKARCSPDPDIVSTIEMVLSGVVVLLAALCLDGSYAILGLGEPIPSDWASNLRYYDYVKDRDDCRFGYRIDAKTRQIINVFNCTNANPDIFFVLEMRTCAASYHVLNRETCASTPNLEEDDVQIAEDINCRLEYKGVAPDPTNCVRYLQCDSNKSTRVGWKTCPRGQFFSNDTYRCEHMWRSNPDGTITSLSESAMCQGRQIPVGSRRNYGTIMSKCLWNWDFNNANSYSVSEPLDCQVYYLCSRFNPSYIDTSEVRRCQVNNTYWSDSQQACVAANQLTASELQECGL